MKKRVYFNFLFVLCLLFLFNSTSFADSPNIEKVTSTIYGLLFKFGVILAVCLTATLAISYMVATPNKKAMLKERLIYYFAGVTFLVGGLAFLNMYEGVSDNVGDTVYNSSAPSKIKEYFKTKTTDPKTTAEEWANTDKEVLNNKAQDVGSNGSENVSLEELALLAYNISKISDEYMDELEFYNLYKHFDELDADKQTAVLNQGQTIHNYTGVSDSDLYPAELDLRDFYIYYNRDDKSEDIFNLDIEDWEDPNYQNFKKNHKWYYENIVLNNYEDLWK